MSFQYCSTWKGSYLGQDRLDDDLGGSPSQSLESRLDPGRAKLLTPGVERFGDSDDPVHRLLTAQLCVLIPVEGQDLETAASIIDKDFSQLASVPDEFDPGG